MSAERYEQAMVIIELMRELVNQSNAGAPESELTESLQNILTAINEFDRLPNETSTRIL